MTEDARTPGFLRVIVRAVGWGLLAGFFTLALQRALLRRAMPAVAGGVAGVVTVVSVVRQQNASARCAREEAPPAPDEGGEGA